MNGSPYLMRPGSKVVPNDLDLISDGISTDSNLEALVSASSNKQLTPTNEQSTEFGCRSKEKHYQMSSISNEMAQGHENQLYDSTDRNNKISHIACFDSFKDRAIVKE